MVAIMNMMLSAEAQPFKLRIEDYELLDRAGAFQDDRVELIEGAIIAVNAQFQTHGLLKSKLGYRLEAALQALGAPYTSVVETSLALPPHNLPNPDILVARVSAERSYVRLQQVALVVEVADTTFRRDLGVKLDMYAANGIPEYWVVDIEGRQVHQFWSPRGNSYIETRIVPLAGELRSATMPELAIEGGGIL